MTSGKMAVLLVLSALITAPLTAQTDETGILEGAVRDQSGSPITGVEVQLAQEDGSYPRRVLTDEAGIFRIPFLKPGVYELNTRAIGFRPTHVTSVRIRAAQVTEITVVSERVAVVLEAITVSAARPIVDRASTEYATTIDQLQLEALPVSRTAADLIQFTPGAQPNQVWGGSTQQANVYQLDGVNVNDPGFGGEFLLPNVDWIEELTVRGLGAGAEYGGFQGGVINMVTRSGTNTFRPRLRFNYEGRSLNATNLNAFEAGEELNRRWELNGELSGPIVRDKLYYYLSAQEVRRDVRVLDALNSTPDNLVFLTSPLGDLRLEEQEQNKLLGKLTWQATPKDILNGMFGRDALFTDNFGLNSFDSPETVRKRESPSLFYNLSWQRAWSADHLTELKVTGYNGRDDLVPLNGDRQAVQLLSGNEEAFRNARHLLRQGPDRLAISANWNSYWKTGTVQHRVKTGGELNYGWWDERETRTGGITWRPDDSDGTFDPEDPATWDFISSDWGGDYHLDAQSMSASGFIQDDITLSSRLTISPGVRLSFFQGKLTPGDGVGETFKAADAVVLAPRIGATIALLDDESLVAKIHWGRYYQDMFALMYDRTLGGNVFTDIEFWDWIDPSLPELDRRYTEAERATLFDLFGSVPTGQEVGPVENYAQPYVDQFIAGLEWEFTPGWKASALYVNRRNRNILSLIDRNLATNYTEARNIQVFDFASGDPVLGPDGQPLVLPSVMISNDDILFINDDVGLTQAELDALGLTAGDVPGLTFNQDLVLTVADDAERKMDQVQVTLERAFRNWALAGSVVWTDLRGNFFSVSGYDSPFGVGVGPFVHPNEMTNFFGKLDNYSDWEVKLRAVGDIPGNIHAGGFLTYFSGDHYTPTYSFDRRNHDYVTSTGDFLNPDLIFGIDGNRVLLEERGSRTFDDRFRVDLHFDYELPLGRAGWVFGLDVFNVFNSSALTELKTSVNNQDPADPTTAFGAPRFRVDGRTIRLSGSVRLF